MFPCFINLVPVGWGNCVLRALNMGYWSSLVANHWANVSFLEKKAIKAKQLAKFEINLL